MAAVVRVIEASLGSAAQLRFVVTGVSDPERLRAAWASSGAMVERQSFSHPVSGVPADRLVAQSTVVAFERAAGRSLPEAEASTLREAANAAVTAWTSPAPPWELPTGPMDFTTTAVMGVCNVTPDSFSDGGVVFPDEHPDAAAHLGRDLVAAGARLIDVGGESSRPGAQPVDAEEERRRVLPVVASLAARGLVVSVDTVKAEVARPAVEAGAVVVNDVSGGQPALLDAVARTGAGYVLMHTRGTPADMQSRTDYADVVAEVYEFLAAGLERCTAAGIPPERVVVDPGIGFAKTTEQNVALLRAVPQLRSLGRPVLIGASRKGFVGKLTGGADVEKRIEGSLAVAALAVADGAAVLRVHDVAETVRVARVAEALRRGPVG